MKESHSSGYLFWVTFCCVLYLGAASDDDLLDFDFTDLKEIDWNYKTDNSKESSPKEPTKKNIITFDDDTDLLEDNQVRPFDWREKILRTALSKALMNKALRQKFVEVMPILRVLSKQQRLALSALITSQINAKKGTELKLSQVRIMFGDDKSLILPIVFDIANLVRNSARKYIEFDYSLRDFADFSKPKKTYERRNLELTSEELAAEENDADIGTLPAAAHVPTHFGLDGLEDFMSDEVLDPKEINEELETLKETTNNNTGLEEVNSGMKPNDDPDGDITYPLDINMQLQNDVPTLTLLKQGKTKTREYSTEAQNPHENSMKQPAAFSSTTDPKATLKRKRRSVREAKEFVHKLVRAVSFSLNGDDLPRSGRAIKLNTTAFASPKETTFRPVSHAAMFSTAASTATISTTTASLPKPTAHESYEPYQLVEDLAFASLNGSEILLDSTEDNEENDLISTVKSEPDDEILPSPEELISGPRYHFSPNKILSSRKRLVPHKRKRLHVRARPKTGVRGNGVAPPKKCERFTPSMCIKTDDYPM